ncbi:MAG: DUF2063 domain-containing protein [Burkholderiales bacterium PBB5]|nr:MAG: DUF2063 domain-containing protein [Burkholderiales bacterium PBB5]
MPDGLRAWNRADPAVRFAVHRNNVLAVLVDALTANFPVVQQLVGDDFFRAMAAVFVRQQPPQPGALAHYGCRDDAWPTFIQGFAPAHAVPYLADVARLEAAWLQSLHAADAPPLTAEAGLVVHAGGSLEGLRLTVHPSLRLLHFGHAAVSLWAAHQTEGELDLAHIDPHAAEAALLLRPGWTVQVLPVPATAWAGLHALLSTLQAGSTLGEAAAAALAAHADFDLTAHLGQLLRAGAFAAKVPARPTDPTGV